MTEWTGYKAQVTETVDGDLPIITDIGIHSAIEADGLALGAIQRRLGQRGLLPEKQYVDRAYCNGKTLQDSERKGLDLRGFIGSNSRKPVGFRLEDFDIDLEKRRAHCPAGKTASTFNPSSQPDVGWNVRFGKQCQELPIQSLVHHRETRSQPGDFALSSTLDKTPTRAGGHRFCQGNARPRSD